MIDGRRLLILLPLLSIAGLSGAAGQQRPAFADRQAAQDTLARLLKIAAHPPAVKAHTLSVTREEDVTIEDLEWESLDGQRVPAFLILPADRPAALPAVICLHGTGGSRESMSTPHFGNGAWTRPGETRPHTRFLGWARELARRGYVVLAMTQRGLDRRQPDTNDQAKELLVRGRTLMGALVYEIRQAASYLEQHPAVDSARIGIAGLSFGGITGFYTWILDPRVQAAALICGGVGSIDELLQRGRPAYHGFYWWIPDMLIHGDQGDFAAGMAPRPLMLWAPLDDVGMPRQGVERFLSLVEPAYAAAGAPEALIVHRPAGEHAFTPEAFEAMCSFLGRFLNVD